MLNSLIKSYLAFPLAGTGTNEHIVGFEPESGMALVDHYIRVDEFIVDCIVTAVVDGGRT